MKKKVKIVQEVNRQKLNCIIYASYMLGYIASQEGRSLSHPDNFEEIKNVIALIK
jgi:hypothetical protein